ncbi:MAG: helix-turn-helix domain-containing protein [Deltaproteobacteria bacterium]|nr:helix-turn-helix domain-containing protein [Deltaproteobacteria bacterium]
MQAQNREWLSTEEAAELLRISVQALRQRCYRGEIPYYKFGRSSRFVRAELEAILLNSKRTIKTLRRLQEVKWQ